MRKYFMNPGKWGFQQSKAQPWMATYGMVFGHCDEKASKKA